jgi:uncharacterized membrane protein
MLWRRLPRALLVVSVAVWVSALGSLIVARHNSVGTFDFDLGIHDQSLWLLANGKSFNTVCGLPVFGHHAMFAYYFLVPLVWLGGGPNLWNVLQVAALGLSAVPVFLVARRRLGGEWPALALALAWLQLPTVGFLAWETLHPETMAVPFVLMAYHLATTRPEGDARAVRRHNLVTVLWLLLAVLWKEDIALALGGMGVVLWVRGRRRFGPVLAVAAGVYFVVFGTWMVPALAGEVTAYSDLFGELGSTPAEVIVNSLRDPGMLLQRLQDTNSLGYAAQTFAPLGFTSLLAPWMLLMGLPQMAISAVSTHDFTRQIYYHYQAMPMVAAILGTVEAAAWINRRKAVLARGVVVVALVASIVASRQWGILPYSEDYRAGFWPPDNYSTTGWDAALARVGPDDSVSAYYTFVPHLTHRELIYTFPNPWQPSNFLSGPSKLVPPSEIKWLVILDGGLGPQPQALLDDLIARGEYGDPETVAGVTTYRRLLP